MNRDKGFYSIATDGSSFYVSNTYRNSICKIGPDGATENDIIRINSPISIAIGQGVLFVLTAFRYIHVYALDLLNLETAPIIPIDSVSDMYPSMVFNPNDELLYISNYTEGTISTLNSENQYTTIVSGIRGVSGLCISNNVLYFSNEIENTVSFYINNTVQTYLSIPKPRSLCSSKDNLYICYGTKEDYGIALHKIDTNTYTNIFELYLSRNIPLTIVSDGTSIYYTLTNVNIVYKNNTIYRSFEFIDKIVATTEITQSVVTKNPNCIQNPAFSGLIALRTVGSNQSNPIIPVTTLVGRTQGSQVLIDPGIGISYSELKMRRKAEILQYRNMENTPGVTLTKKQSLSNIVNRGGSYQYSKAKLNKLSQEQQCRIGLNNGKNLEKNSPSHSGIIDPSFEGYYLNSYVPYYASI